MNRVKQILLIAVLMLLVVVMVQNAQPVKFRFLNWTYDVSQLLLVLIVFVVGFLSGFAVAKWPRRKQDDLAPIQTRR
ncbi:MAG TPA: lipopolysaccharide assembly protein LapA domain-containing protein [Candidatus Krumholzibacteria bacterium]|nr:lipopolysaccharide assembly protein LapA domain-containing protein [Candidatus Krumholzibacteria bacterium]